MATSKKLYKTVLFSSLIISIISVFCLYWFTSSLIVQFFTTIEGALQVVLIISGRVVILVITTYYLFHKWFQQEAQYLSDIPFLLGLFFLILVFGKLIDLHWNMTFYLYEEALVLLYIKFRFLIIILEVAPLIFLGLEIIFFRLEEKFPKLREKHYMNRLRLEIMVLIVAVEVITVFVVPNFTIIGMVLAFILIPSLVGIVYIFFLAYRLNRLSVVKPKIVTIGFFLYLISNIFRPVMQNILGENASYITVVELVDLAIFIVIFFGLYKKS
ncbi:MAG: hypothetical protein ACXAEX_15765 [Promethearchaeota archaeon]|jgi:hypothetical protein